MNDLFLDVLCVYWEKQTHNPVCKVSLLRCNTILLHMLFVPKITTYIIFEADTFVDTHAPGFF